MPAIVLGIIGTGRIGKMHLENIVTRIPSFRVKWACDLKLESDVAMKEFVQKFNIANLTTDYTKVLADPEVQAVLITSSTESHTKISIDAAKAKKHIFCEKPVSYSAEEIRQVAAAVKEAGVKYQVGFNRRFDHNFSHLRSVVEKGGVGRPQIVRVTSRDPTFDPAYIENSSKHGGILIDMTIHDFDMANFVFNVGNTSDPLNDVEEVYAVGSATIDPIFAKGNDYDLVMITLKLKNGSIASIDNSRRAVYGYDQRVEAFGTEGMIIADNDTPTTCKHYTKDDPTADKIHWWFFGRYREAFITELLQFAESIAKDTPSPVGCDDMLRALLLAQAGNESLKTGKPVKVASWK